MLGLASMQRRFELPGTISVMVQEENGHFRALTTLDPVDPNDGRRLRDHEVRDFHRGRLAGAEAELRTGMGVQNTPAPKLSSPT